MISSPEWWPHDDEPYLLVDTPDEGMIETHAYAPVRLIEGDDYAEIRATGGLEAAARAAVEHLDRYGTIVPDDVKLVLTDEREWWRPLATLTGDGEWLIDSTGDEDLDDENGAGMRCEFCPWEPCKPDAPGAVEFYVLEAAEK